MVSRPAQRGPQPGGWVELPRVRGGRSWLGSFYNINPLVPSTSSAHYFNPHWEQYKFERDEVEVAQLARDTEVYVSWSLQTNCPLDPESDGAGTCWGKNPSTGPLPVRCRESRVISQETISTFLVTRETLRTPSIIPAATSLKDSQISLRIMTRG